MSLLSGLTAAAGGKFVTGVAVAAFAATAAGAAVEANASGSASPDAWGQQVEQQVRTCKDALQPGQHGIGQCVSAFASQHGQQERDAHRASQARRNQPAKLGKGVKPPKAAKSPEAEAPDQEKPERPEAEKPDQDGASGQGNGNGHGNGHGNANGHGQGHGRN